MDKSWKMPGHTLEVIVAEVRFQIDNDFLQNLQKKLGTTKSTDVVRDALTLLNWAVKEKSEGRDIASAKDGNVHANVAIASLDNIKGVS